MKSEKRIYLSGAPENGLLQETCYKITGCAIDILNALGPGLPEDIYARCLKKEMKKRGISFECDCVRPLVYDGERVGEIVAPFVVENCLVSACFATEAFNDTDYSRFISCLRAFSLPLALLFNFQFGKLQWKKIISERF